MPSISLGEKPPLCQVQGCHRVAKRHSSGAGRVKYRGMCRWHRKHGRGVNSLQGVMALVNDPSIPLVKAPAGKITLKKLNELFLIVCKTFSRQTGR